MGGDFLHTSYKQNSIIFSVSLLYFLLLVLVLHVKVLREGPMQFSKWSCFSERKQSRPELSKGYSNDLNGQDLAKQVFVYIQLLVHTFYSTIGHSGYTAMHSTEWKFFVQEEEEKVLHTNKNSFSIYRFDIIRLGIHIYDTERNFNNF